MKTDTSLLLYQKYYSLSNNEIEVELKNSTKLRGKFIGYFRGNLGYILKWQLVDLNILFASDTFGFLIGKIIYHRDILEVRFLEDNTVMTFNS